MPKTLAVKNQRKTALLLDIIDDTFRYTIRQHLHFAVSYDTLNIFLSLFDKNKVGFKKNNQIPHESCVL